jgi:curved DNA-binding protein CbpA
MPPVVRAQLDYYAMLEVDSSADVAEINAAFRRLAWRFHPDRNPAPGSTLQFQDINEAHQVLSDPERRSVYDAEWHPEARTRREEARRVAPPHFRRVARRRRRHIRTGVVAVCAFMFVSSAWALIFTSIRSARPAVLDEVSYAPATVSDRVTPDYGFSMEIFPVVYTDDHGRKSTAWETNVRNRWGASARILSTPDLSQHRAANDRTRPWDRSGPVSR